MYRSGKPVFFLNYTNFKADFASDFAALRREATTEHRILSQTEPVLAVVDLRGATGAAAIVDVFKQRSKQTSPIMDRLAVVGITGIKRFFAELAARISGSEMRLFDTQAEAVAWLLNRNGQAELAFEPWC